MIVAYAIQAKNYNDALAQLDKMIAANEGDKNKNLSDALSISLQTNNQQRANQYMSQLGENLNPQTRLFVAQSYVKAKRYKEGLDMIAPLREMPSEPLLLFLQDTYNQMNDAANRRTTLEQLVANYPKPQYWHDLLQLARNERGLSDEQGLDIYRLRMAVGDLKTDTDYSEMAQLALVAGYPAEAKSVLDKAAAAKVLAGERADRLIKMTNDRVGQDSANQSELQKKAAADPNASVKLGIVYWTYGKQKEAEEAIRNGMKGKLADPEGAKVALGHVLFSSGKKPDAVTAFNSVAKTSKEAPVARLWAIYARRG
jgi:thioredoxin-like negative regulator of GroEL